jgi:hypothetical protein
MQLRSNANATCDSEQISYQKTKEKQRKKQTSMSIARFKPATFRSKHQTPTAVVAADSRYFFAYL